VNKEINKTVIIAGRVKRKASQLSSSLHSSARRNSAFQCIFNINKHFSFFSSKNSIGLRLHHIQVHGKIKRVYSKQPTIFL